MSSAYERPGTTIVTSGLTALSSVRVRTAIR